MAIDSKLMYGTYVYPFPVDPLNPNRGDIGTIAYDDGVPSLTVHKGVRTTYSSGTPTNIGPDPKPLFFKNGAGLNRAAVASIVWVGTVATCTWLVYEADADNTTPFTWNDPVAGPVVLTIGGVKTVTNPYALKTREVSSGVVDLYCIDYDGKFVFRVRSSGVNGDTYTVQNGYYEFAGVNSNDSFGVDLEITDDYLYALFINGTNLSAGAPTANYLNSTVVKLDFGLGTPPLAYVGPYTSTTTGSGFPAKNAFSIQAYGSDLILTAIGGPQHGGPTYGGQWNPDSRIQKIDQSTLVVTNLLRAAANSGEPPEDQYDFRALSFSSDGSVAFILLGVFDTSWVMDWHLYSTDMTTITTASNALLSSLSPIEVGFTNGEDGYYWALWISESTGKTWLARGNDFAIFDPSTLVVDVSGIGSISTFSVGDFPGLNFATIYEGEVAPSPHALKGYVAPAFASNTAQALAEREKFFQEVAAAKAKR
ncbi:hypothetical protein SPFL3102_01853 [Sporomusaceae bacterium FL31]|nr:hypothetical protein SPFL3101_03487 [Sporomusaceae bacterium FL31]GCE34044.1 hypothetical protein SPFL3102_01853 [Sporomusaceae bacterium]